MTDTPVVTEGAAFADLESFLGWLTRTRERMAQVIAEVEQLQAALNGRWGRCHQTSQEMAQTAAALLAELGAGGPGWAQEWAQAHQADDRAAASASLEALRARAAELEAVMQAARAEAIAEREKLAADNPLLNAREEELKATRAAQEAALEEARAELAQAAAGVGWLLRAGHVRELRQAYTQRETELHGTLARLQEVRLAWQTEATEGDETETRLAQQWRDSATALAQVRADLAPLEADLEGAVRLASLRGLVDSLQEARETGDPACDEALAGMVAARAECAEVEDCLKKGAEVLGLLKGLVTSVERFQETVRGMRQEEEMHAELSRLKLEAPAGAGLFTEACDELMALVQDEQAAADEPVALADRLRGALETRLSAERIEATFTALGECLSQAAGAQWK